MCQSAPMAPTGHGTSEVTRALVVEDEPDIAAQIAHRLTAEGWRVEVASDGPAGVAAAQSFQPDVVVLDVMLPGIDGLEVRSEERRVGKECVCRSYSRH